MFWEDELEMECHLCYCKIAGKIPDSVSDVHDGSDPDKTKNTECKEKEESTAGK